MKKWANTRRGKQTIGGILISLVVIMSLGVTIFVTNRANYASSSPANVPSTTITPSQQAFIVARSGLAPVDWTPTKADVQAGFAPVVALSSNLLINKVETTTGTVGAISVNAQTNTVAFVVKTAGGEYKGGYVLYVSSLLPAQMSSATTALSKFDTGIQVVHNTDAVTTLNAGFMSDYINGTTSTQTAPRGAYVNAADVGTTSPYVTTLSDSIAQAGALASAAAATASSTLLSNLLFFFVIAGIVVFIIIVRRRQAKNGPAGVRGPSDRTSSGPLSKNNETIPTTRFEDVAGADEAIEEMAELVEFLKNPEKFTRVGARAPRGALLVGPPGTGKTLLARAVAGEAGVPFYAVAGSDFVEMYVGLGAKRVRELFAKARKHSEGAIVFIDEIDAVGRSRSSNTTGGSNAETENTLNALLVELDGFAASKVIVLAASNRDDVLDAALTRPGRLDRKVQVPLPDRLGREKILAVHARNKPVAADVDFSHLARRTPGMSGAELSQLVNEAAMCAARDGRNQITVKDFDAAIATVVMGKARNSAVVTEHDRLVTAWHEGGHAAVGMILDDADDPVSVSIIPRGPAGGVTWFAQGDDIFLTRRRAFARLVVAMGGRAAEEILLNGEFTSGPSGDLQGATQIALQMVTQFGMSKAGLMVKSEGLLSTGSQVTDETIAEVEALLAEALVHARDTLATHHDLLKKIVDGLLEYDTLGQAELLEIQGKEKRKSAAFPVPPKEYRKVVPSQGVTHEAPVERVSFKSPRPRRVLKLGNVTIQLGTPKNKSF